MIEVVPTLRFGYVNESNILKSKDYFSPGVINFLEGITLEKVLKEDSNTKMIPLENTPEFDNLVFKTAGEFKQAISKLKSYEALAVNWALNVAYNTHKDKDEKPETRGNGLSYMFHLVRILNKYSKLSKNYLDYITIILHDSVEKKIDLDYELNEQKYQNNINKILTLGNSSMLKTEFSSLELNTAFKNELFRQNPTKAPIFGPDTIPKIIDYFNSITDDEGKLKKVDEHFKEIYKKVLENSTKTSLRNSYLGQLQDIIVAHLFDNKSTDWSTRNKLNDIVDSMLIVISNLTRYRVPDHTYAGHTYSLNPFNADTKNDNPDGLVYRLDSEKNKVRAVAELKTNLFKLLDRTDNLSELYSYYNFIPEKVLDDNLKNLEKLLDKQGEGKYTEWKESLGREYTSRFKAKEDKLDSNTRIKEIFKSLFVSSLITKAMEHYKLVNNPLFNDKYIQSLMKQIKNADFDLNVLINKQARLQKKRLWYFSPKITSDFVYHWERNIEKYDSEGLLSKLTNKRKRAEFESEHHQFDGLINGVLVPLMLKDEIIAKEIAEDKRTRFKISLAFERLSEKKIGTQPDTLRIKPIENQLPNPAFRIDGIEAVLLPYMDFYPVFERDSEHWQ